MKCHNISFIIYSTSKIDIVVSRLKSIAAGHCCVKFRDGADEPFIWRKSLVDTMTTDGQIDGGPGGKGMTIVGKRLFVVIFVFDTDFML